LGTSGEEGFQTNLLTAVADNPHSDAEATLKSLLGRGWYVFGPRTPGLKRLKEGDHVAFYRKGAGVVAEAIIATKPEKKRLEWFHGSERFPWAVRVKDARYFFDKPVVIDKALRSRLQVFQAKEYGTWAWFVQSAQILSDHDFDVLVGRK